MDPDAGRADPWNFRANLPDSDTDRRHLLLFPKTIFPKAWRFDPLRDGLAPDEDNRAWNPFRHMIRGSMGIRPSNRFGRGTRTPVSHVQKRGVGSWQLVTGRRNLIRRGNFVWNIRRDNRLPGWLHPSCRSDDRHDYYGAVSNHRPHTSIL